MSKVTREKFKTLDDVFDKFTIRNLFVLSSKGYFDEDSLSPISIGKEANVFMAKRGDDDVCVKIYRLETCDFNRMFQYIRVDPRYDWLKNRRRDVIFAWSKREFRNLLAARQAGVTVPIPIASKDNILVMQLIGDPARKLKDAPPTDPKKFLKKITGNIKKFYKAGYVHGDLSAFNILNHKDIPYFIDFSQAMPTKAPNTDELLVRDVKNIVEHFKRLGISSKKDTVIKAVIGKQ